MTENTRPIGVSSGESTFPVLPLRDIVVFPHMIVPLFVGREKSINALEEAMSQDKEILLAAQKKAKTNDPTPEDIAQACRQIQSEWDDNEFRRRAGLASSGVGWVPPTARLGLRFDGADDDYMRKAS